MCNLLMIIPIFVFSMALPGFWERPQTLPVQRVEVSPGPNTRVGTVEVCRCSHRSLNCGGQMSDLLIQEGQWVEAIVHFSRESGR